MGKYINTTWGIIQSVHRAMPLRICQRKRYCDVPTARSENIIILSFFDSNPGNRGGPLAGATAL